MHLKQKKRRRKWPWPSRTYTFSKQVLKDRFANDRPDAITQTKHNFRNCIRISRELSNNESSMMNEPLGWWIGHLARGRGLSVTLLVCNGMDLITIHHVGIVGKIPTNLWYVFMKRSLPERIITKKWNRIKKEDRNHKKWQTTIGRKKEKKRNKGKWKPVTI